MLVQDKGMAEIHLRELGSTYSVWEQFTKNKEKIKQFKETGGSRYIYQKELDKACCQHDTAYGDFKDLRRRSGPDKVLPNKVCNIAKIPIYDEYQGWSCFNSLQNISCYRCQ